MKEIFVARLLVLIMIVPLYSSCGQTQPYHNKTKKTSVKNYFDSDNQILLKLYQKTSDGLHYWETWNNDDKTATIHWGILGDYGEKKMLTTKGIGFLKDTINALIADKIKEGFSEIQRDKQFTLSITFKLDTWGALDDIYRREKYRNILTEHLGWTGNGNCNDGDIGSGEMTLFADVVDPYTAIKTIQKEMQRNEIKEKYYFVISQGEKTISDKIFPDTEDKH